MKLERLNEHMTTVTAVIVGGVVAYGIGLLAGEGSIGTILGLIGGGLFLAVLLSLKQHVWVLIPICWGFGGDLSQLPGHPSLLQVVILGVFGATFVLTAVKAIRFKPQLRAVDFWMWATLIYLLITWMRHPAGGLILNSEVIGGRAYLDTAISFAGYFVLNRSFIPLAWNPQWLAFWSIGAGTANGLLQVVTHFIPALGRGIGILYSGVEQPEESTADNGTFTPMSEPSERHGYLQVLTMPLISWLLSYYRPFTLISPLFPLRTFLFWIGMLGCLMAGFRSSLINIFMLMLLASYLRRGTFEVVRMVVLAALGVVMLSIMSYFVHLPKAVQRALSFLPGQWDSSAVASAENSSQWRYFMWEQMLTNKKYLENKWLGDGFGFSIRQYAQMFSDHSNEQAQRNFLITGQVHSGPISAIRFVGYVGLVLYLCLLTVVARAAFRLCKETMNTPLGVLTWYFALPLVLKPFVYVFIFGAYDGDVPGILLSVGMLNMLRNSHELREAAKTQEESESPRPLRPAGRVRRPSLHGKTAGSSYGERLPVI